MYRLSTCSDCVDCPFVSRNNKIYHEIHISFDGIIPDRLHRECIELDGKIITVDNKTGTVETMTSVVFSGQCKDAMRLGKELIDLAKFFNVGIVREKYESSVFHLNETDEQPGYFEGHLSVKSSSKDLLNRLEARHSFYISQNRAKPDILMASIRSRGSLQKFRNLLDETQADLKDFVVGRREEYCYFDTNPEKDWIIR